jgi:hypothetical protein
MLKTFDIQTTAIEKSYHFTIVNDAGKDTDKYHADDYLSHINP